MTNPTRLRMLQGTIELIRQRGINATSNREVVRFSGTPRGSLSYYFPEGRIQLLTEALGLARTHISDRLRQQLASDGAVRGLELFVADWEKQLQASGFSSGCPMLAAATEQLADEACQASRLREQAKLAFQEWQHLLAEQLCREGASAENARALAQLTIASFEGALALCQSEQSISPLADITRTLTFLFTQATGSHHEP